MPAPYESWTVYQKALRLRKIAGHLKRTAPRGLSSDLNNLVRGTSSIVYNLVEGAGRFSKADKLHFYRISLGSANECKTAFAVLIADLGETELLAEARDEAQAIMALLNGLIKSIENRPDV